MNLLQIIVIFKISEQRILDKVREYYLKNSLNNGSSRSRFTL